MCFPAQFGAANTFLCHTVTTWRGGPQECGWEFWVPFCGHLVEVTVHLPNWASARMWADWWLQKPQRVKSKANAVRSKKKIAVGLIFKQLLGLTALGPTEKKLEFYCIRYPCWPHGVSLQFPRNFQTDLHSLDLSYRKSDRLDVWIIGFLPLWVWVFCGQASLKLRLKNDFQTQYFKLCVTLSTQNAGIAIFLWGKRCINRECFQACIYQECSSF